MALEGGCRWIQLRMKDATDDEVREAASEIQPLCKAHDAIFLPVDEARRLLGEEFIIGGTANTFDDIERLAAQGVDYIGCGPFRFTTTKKNLSPVLGIEGYRDVMEKMEKAGMDVPVVAIGGITADDIDNILATGVRGIAVSGTVLNAEDPVAMMRTLIQGTNI